MLRRGLARAQGLWEGQVHTARRPNLRTGRRSFLPANFQRTMNSSGAMSSITGSKKPVGWGSTVAVSRIPTNFVLQDSHEHRVTG